MEEKRLCEHITFLIHAPLRVYNKCGSREMVYADHGEQIDILEADPEFEAILLGRKSEASPILYIEQNHIAYGIIAGIESDYILGPCCLDFKSVSMVYHLLLQHKISGDTPYRIGYIGLLEFGEIIVMLYEAVTGRIYDRDRLLISSLGNAATDTDIGKQRQQVFYERQEEAILHNPYSQDLQEQESIKRGDLEGLYKSFQISYSGKPGRLASDEIRSQKNLAIGLIAVSCRSAIAGGVLPEIAFSMSDAYIRQVETVRQEGAAFAVSRKAEIDFCQMVQESQRFGRQSLTVMRCKELVLKHLHSKLSARDLANELGVTPGHLSQIFTKEEGMTLTDYIACEKIKFAKEQLVYTDDSYDTVAYTYGFSSQSHFGSVFKKWTQMTPGEFRNKYKKKSD